MDLKKEFLKDNGISISKAKKILANHEKDTNGNIIIKNGRFIISRKSVKNYSFAVGLVLLVQDGLFNRQDVQGRMALVKSYIHDKCPDQYKGIDAEMTMANNFIMPEIAKQFQLEVAEYYNVVFEDCDELESKENYRQLGREKEQKIKPGHRYLLTPSFLRPDEELLHFADIIKDRYNLKASEILSEIIRYLEIRHVPETDIKAIRGNFIKQCIFNKYIDFSDEHNLNAGIIIKKEPEGIRARLAPCYDLDFAAGVYNTTDNGIQPRFYFRKSNNGGIDLKDILEQFYGDFELKYLEEIIYKIDIDQAMDLAEEYGNFTLSDLAKTKYRDFFKIQQNDLESFLKNKYKEKYDTER